MIVTSSSPPSRPTPQSLRDRSAYSLRDVPASSRSDVPTGNFKKMTERKRPKSTPPKISHKFLSKDRHNDKESVRAIKGAFNDKDNVCFKVIQPGYAIAKRKSGINVILNMDELLAGADKGRKSQPAPDIRDIKIKKLLEEIEDLKATLDEERVLNKVKFQQFVQDTKTDFEVMLQEHRDHIRTIEEDHELELENMKAIYEAEINSKKGEAILQVAQMQEEIDLINKTLASCKEVVTAELEEVWSLREEKLYAEQKLKTERLLVKQSRKLKSELNASMKEMASQHAKELENVEELHRAEIQALQDEFAVCTADVANLKQTAEKVEALEYELSALQDAHASVKEKLRKTMNELADAKVQLQGYELSFSEKVAEVEERYSMKMQGLMLSNSDMRRKYMKKCAELLDIPNKSNPEKERKMSDPKNTMKAIILARAKADLSLVTAKRNNEMELSRNALTPQRRSKSAPCLRQESFEETGMFLTISELRTFRPNSSLA